MFIHHSGIIGGAGVSLINTIDFLSDNNEVYVYVSSEPEDMFNLFKNMSNNVHVDTYGRRIGALTYYSGGDSWFSKRFLYRMILIRKQKQYWNDLVRELNPEIIVVNSKILCWLSSLSEVKKRKSVCFVRETIKGQKNNIVNKQISKYLDGFSKVVFISEYDKRKENLKIAKTYVVHNYVAKNQFDTSITKQDACKKLDVTEKTFNILYVGGVSEMKGFDLAVQATLMLGEKCTLIVAGNNFDDAMKTKDKHTQKYVKKWKKYILESDKNHQIHFLGRVKDMSPCYAACDVLVFPMRSPHQSRPAFEAGYFYKPVVITDFENVSEFVRNNYNGLTFKNGDVNSLFECLSVLRDNKEYCKELGLNNFLNTKMNHNMDISCSKIEKIIEE